MTLRINPRSPDTRVVLVVGVLFIPAPGRAYFPLWFMSYGNDHICVRGRSPKLESVTPHSMQTHRASCATKYACWEETHNGQFLQDLMACDHGFGAGLCSCNQRIAHVRTEFTSDR